MTNTEYKHCPVCGAVLVRSLYTNIVQCKLCGWSENKESDDKEVRYVG
jgi:uncharacterized Zn finger protein (UPF0148 family)